MPVHFLPENEVQMSQAAQTSEEAAAPERKLTVAPDSESKSPSGSLPYPNWSRFMKKLIKKTGKSGSQLAGEFKISQTQVSRWTRGLARPATMEGALEMVASVGGDVQAAQAAWNADVARPRGARGPRTRKAAKAVKAASAPTARKKPGPKPGSTRAAKKATPVEKPATRSTTREVGPPADGTPADVVLEGISLAQRALVEAEKGIDDAVAAARAAGISWPEIGKALSGA